ncbi:hypothetical protein AUP68_04279 [Ilyonectria robusta]
MANNNAPRAHRSCREAFLNGLHYRDEEVYQRKERIVAAIKNWIHNWNEECYEREGRIIATVENWFHDRNEEARQSEDRIFAAIHNRSHEVDETPREYRGIRGSRRNRFRQWLEGVRYRHYESIAYWTRSPDLLPTYQDACRCETQIIASSLSHDLPPAYEETAAFNPDPRDATGHAGPAVE